MAAVLGLTGPEIEKVIEKIDGVEIANYNCPGQIVITGEKAAVEIAAAQLKTAGARGKVLPLKVSGPFHSSMMEAAGRKLEKVLETTEIQSLKDPLCDKCYGKVCNRPCTDPSAAGQTDFLFRPLAAKCGADDQCRDRYLCGDRTRQDAYRFYKKDR